MEYGFRFIIILEKLFAAELSCFAYISWSKTVYVLKNVYGVWPSVEASYISRIE